MKKLLSMLTIGILTSTSVINTNMFLNSSFDQKQYLQLVKNNKKPVFVDLKENKVGNYLYFNQDKMVFIDNQKNTYFVDNLGNFKSLNKKSDDAGSENFVPLNQNVGVFKSENGNSNLLDSNGKFINLGKIGDFFNWNDEKGLYIDESQNMFFLTKTGQFISITKPEADMIPQDIQKFNNNLFFIWDSISKKSYLLSQEAIFQEIKKDGQSIQINSFCSFNDNLAFVETTKTGVAPDYRDINQSWLMNSNGDFIKEIKKEGSYILGGDKYNWNDENIIYIEQDTSDVYLLSSNGSFKSLNKKALRFEKWTNTLGFFELNSGECWLTDISDVLKPENYILDKKVFSFSKLNENLAVFMSLFDFTEPHYQAMAHNYLLILIEALMIKKIKINLSSIIKYFPTTELKQLIDKNNPKYIFVAECKQAEVNGLLNRLSVYAEQLNNSIGLKNDLTKISKNHNIILFSLNSLDYPQLASNIGKLLIQDLKEFASIKPRNQHINVVLDEFNVFASDSIINLINKTRSFNYQCFLCLQTINDLKTANKDLTDTIFGNTANIIAHNVKDPNSAEYLAKVFGTKTSQKITKQYDIKNKSSSKGSIREVEEYIVHPNDLKKLKVGQAYVKILLPSSNQYVDKIAIENDIDE